MKIFTLLVILLLQCTTLNVYGKVNSKNIIFDYYFLIDVSGSMIGKPIGSGNSNILPKVKTVINNFLSNIHLPANVIISPFDEGIHGSKTFYIEDLGKIKVVQDFVDQLIADGSNTWIYRSLCTTVDEIEKTKVLDKDREHISLIYLYTDGLDNDPYEKDVIEKIKNNFIVKMGEFDWLFYIALGTSIPKPITMLEKTTPLPSPEGFVPPIILINNRILKLPYGNLWKTNKGTMEALFSINGLENIPDDTMISIKENDNNTIISNGLGFSIKPNKFKPNSKINLTLELNNFNKKNKNHYGVYDDESLHLALSTNKENIFVIPNKIYISFNYSPPPPLPTWILILITISSIIIFYIIFVLLFCIISGNDLSLWPWMSNKKFDYSVSFDIIEPLSNKGETLDVSDKISRKKELIFGKDSEYFSSVQDKFVLKIVKEEGINVLRITVESGNIILQNQIEQYGQEIVSDIIYDGDILIFSEYKIRLSSFSFIRE